ncbi:GrpB family protein [Mycoplasmatota bacterium WC44]
MSKIIVVDYDPKWKEIFENYKVQYLEIMKDIEVDIQHVGSTSINGLAAKPIIDIDIIVEEDYSLECVIEKLKILGYKHRGDLGITGREAFKLKQPNSKFEYQHNLYAGKRESLGIQNHLKFRNYLRHNPKDVREYSKLKKGLARDYEFDIDSYIDGKTDFIVGILKCCGMTDREQNVILEQNKL